VSGYGVNRFAATLKITAPLDEIVIASGKPSAPYARSTKSLMALNTTRALFRERCWRGSITFSLQTAVGADITLYVKDGHENLAASYGESAAKILSFFFG